MKKEKQQKSASRDGDEGGGKRRRASPGREAASGEPQTLTPQFRHMALQAAVMQFKHGQSVQDISAQLGKSTSYVSRLIRAAIHHGWVRFVVTGAPQVELESAIIAETRGRLRHVRVIETLPDEPDRERALGAATAQLIDELLVESAAQMVAIGGSTAMLAAAQAVTPRLDGPSVVPTSLPQVTGALERGNAQVVATLLAAQWGAIPAAHARHAEERRHGKLYLASLGRPPDEGGLSGRAEWFRTLESRVPRLGEVFEAWRRTRIAVVGIAPFSVESMYDDVRKEFEKLKVDLDELRRREVVGLLANRLISRSGTHVFLDAEARVPGLEVSIPTDMLRALGSGQGAGSSVLVCNGNQGRPAASAVWGRMANCLVCDVRAGESFLGAWRELEGSRRLPA